ncbi:hypothetical protein GCM10011491_41530 [Brucella endophytica]|uniref:Uncharacterized protein n=1 Tax=Brucella endophytica TaxID=1963359 RepID=A0A916SNS1_9HYPH|nr:hypothetical protein GCM10011491_41530 [Brucella endophytica]
MGYWEQTGVANLRYEQKRAAMHPFRRVLQDALKSFALVVVASAVWLLIFFPKFWQFVAFGW